MPVCLVEDLTIYLFGKRKGDIDMDKCRQQNCRNQRNMTRGYNRQAMGCKCEQSMNHSCNQSCNGYMDKYVCNEDCPDVLGDPINGMPIAMGYVPWQRFCNLYEECEAMYHGTIFHDLDLDFYGKRC